VCQSLGERRSLVSEPQTIRQYAIYEHPRDYPDGYVVREWIITAGRVEMGEAKQADDLEGARALLPEGVSRLDTWDDPDETIVEVWM
jgi:hypothetical protein